MQQALQLFALKAKHLSLLSLVGLMLIRAQMTHKVEIWFGAYRASAYCKCSFLKRHDSRCLILMLGGPLSLDVYSQFGAHCPRQGGSSSPVLAGVNLVCGAKLSCGRAADSPHCQALTYSALWWGELCSLTASREPGCMENDYWMLQDSISIFWA